MEIQPRKSYLILVLIVTTILAAAGTFALYETSNAYDVSRLLQRRGSVIFLCFVLAGYAVFAGYIATAFCRRHFAAFWLFSLLYNLTFSICYIYLIFSGLIRSSSWNSFSRINAMEFGVIFTLLLWTSFVTYASGYYLKHSLRRSRTEYP